MIFCIKDWFGDFSIVKRGGNSEIVTSRSRLLLINVMERDKGRWGVKNMNFGVT